MLYFWDCKADKIAKMPSISAAAISSIAYSRDGEKIFLGTGSGLIYVLDHAGNKIKELVGHTSLILGVFVSPDNRYAISMDSTHQARLWDLVELKSVLIMVWSEVQRRDQGTIQIVLRSIAVSCSRLLDCGKPGRIRVERPWKPVRS